jgi:hypothetical protein
MAINMDCVLLKNMGLWMAMEKKYGHSYGRFGKYGRVIWIMVRVGKSR